MTITEWYQQVNATWPKEVPKLTEAEAIAAARRLYRYGMGRTFKGEVKVTSGNRYTWIRRGVMVVNPGHGWHGLIHLMSHYIHSRTKPDEKPHSRGHARLELRMVKEVIKRGWLDGKLAQAAQDRARIALEKRASRNSPESKLARLRQREKRWITRTRRAVTALKKIRRSITRLEKTIGQNGQAE